MTDFTANIDPYHVLQVQRHAAPEVIRAAYRALAWKYHPDRGATPEGMVVLNHAWSILGDPALRAAYDAKRFSPLPAPAPAPAAASRAVPGDPAPARDGGLLSRRPTSEDAATVIDFGRYEGWTIARLADHDPDYLRWLARTPVGRRLAPAIDSALAGREGVPARA